MGVLPELLEQKIPEAARVRILQIVQNVVDTAYRAGPESVIDRARDLAVAALGAHFGDVVPEAAHKDLSAVADVALREKRYLVSTLARSIAILHSRTKPNEQEKRGLRPPQDEDAALALESISTILRELGWAQS